MKIWAKTTTHKEGKYLVVRRDGTVPAWPHFVLGARDLFSPIALRAYADAIDRNPNVGIDPEYSKSIRELANDFERYRAEYGSGDPDAPPHRADNSEIIAVMKGEHLMVELKPDRPATPAKRHLIIDYTNYRGERGIREIEPRDLRWGNEYHPNQWVLDAFDVKKKQIRSFALVNIHSSRVVS